jgi:hypothetical protein
VTVIFRRIAAFAVAGALALAPTASHAFAEEALTVPGTTCTVGNETLTYDPVRGDWNASSTIMCANPYPQLVLSVSVVLVQATGNSVAIPQSGVFCLECPAMQHRVSRSGPWFVTGLYQVRSSAMVQVPTHSWLNAEHYFCFLVKDFDSKPLMAGCPKIR